MTSKISFAGLPSMVPAYARVLMGRKPYSAPEGTVVTPIELEVRRVKLSAAHLARYRDICGVPEGSKLPPAYLHTGREPEGLDGEFRPLSSAHHAAKVVSGHPAIC